MKPLSEIQKDQRAKMEVQRVKRQLACKHKGTIYEHGYTSYMYGSASADWRTCKSCGFTEDGWGYQILKGEAIRNDKKAIMYRVGSKHYNGNFVRVGDEFNKRVLYEMAVRK